MPSLAQACISSCVLCEHVVSYEKQGSHTFLPSNPPHFGYLFLLPAIPLLFPPLFLMQSNLHLPGGGKRAASSPPPLPSHKNIKGSTSLLISKTT